MVKRRKGGLTVQQTETSSKYSNFECDGINMIVCPDVIDGACETLVQCSKIWLLSDAEIHVLDFRNVTELKASAYRVFTSIHRSLKSHEKKMFCINVPMALSFQLSQDGMNAVFSPIRDLAETGTKPKSAGVKSVIDVDFINPFISATQKVFETQANTPMKVLKPYAKKPNEVPSIEVAGVISLVSKGFNGSITICFTSQVFLKIYENMVGETHTELSSEIEDAAGELLNMIFGQAKTVLNDQKGHTFEKAIPTILVGEKLRLRQKGTSPVIILPFESSAGQFHIEVFVENTAAKTTAAA